MKFKTKEIQFQWNSGKLDKQLVTIVHFIDSLIANAGLPELVITSIYRDEPKSSVHAWWRGVDIRTWEYTEEFCEALVALINAIYPYEKEDIKTAMYHDVGRGPHFHLQVKS